MDRRTSPRHPAAGHLWWTRLGDAVPQHGWVSDQSRRGVSFITAYARRLNPGDTITISEGRAPQDDRDANMPRFSVRRVEPYDERLSLVACARQRR